MERKDFLKKSVGFLGLAVAAPSLLSAKLGFENNNGITTCSVTNSETAGPFPTITPTSLVRSNIVADGRTGIPIAINITINNLNANCGAYQGCLVDIWHCDKDGYYSEYGGTGMQSVNYTSVHFLRGRQITDTNGLAVFSSIFPGWYSGRTTHIHVHIYKPNGTSLLVTQIAFPEGAGSAVSAVNASTANGYTKGMTGYTFNANDNVFSDGVTNELSTISGSVAAGFVLDHSIFVNGPTLAIDQLSLTQNQIGHNFPNPFSDKSVIPLQLNTPSDIKIEIYDMAGRYIDTAVQTRLNAGQSEISIDRNKLKLSSGYYIYKVSIANENGTTNLNKMMIVK